LTDYVYRNSTVEILYNPAFKLYSADGEAERDFLIRLQQVAREYRDELAEDLRKKYGPKIAALQEKVRKADQAVRREEGQAKAAKNQTAISIGSTLLGAFMGRKTFGASTLSRASGAARSAERSKQQAGDVVRSRETLATYQADLAALEAEFEAEVQGLDAKLNAAVTTLETVSLRPLKRDCLVLAQAILWLPYARQNDGSMQPVWSE
jgi:hypothetical protein